MAAQIIEKVAVRDQAEVFLSSGRFYRADLVEHAPIIAELKTRQFPREEVAALLESRADAMQAPGEALKNIWALRDTNTFVVATGQQAGFLGGPLYTLHKALGAIRLAREYEYMTGGKLNFIPMFWVASDDHDIAEIDHAYFLAGDGELRRVTVPIRSECRGCSAANVFADKDGLAEAAKALESIIPAEQLAEFVSLYAEYSLSDAFTILLNRWLGPLGLVVAQAHELRKLAGNVILRDLNEYHKVSETINAAGKLMKDSGYKPGFPEPLRMSPHFFISAGPGCLRAHLDPVESKGEILFRERSAAFAEHKHEPRTYTHGELETLIRERPELFSASAALRPVVQQTLFPVVAAVLGPGERMYWSQLEGVHEQFGATFPAVVPRVSMTLLDAKADKARRKMELSASDVLLSYDDLRQKVLRSGELQTKLKEHGEKMVAEFDALSSEVFAADASLVSMLQKSRERIRHELSRIEEKTLGALSQREDAAGGRLKYLSTLVRPKKEPQERILNTGQWMASNPDLPGELIDFIPPVPREHLLVTLDR